MKSLPTGTVTFLFTDIEGSTMLLQSLGDSRYAEVLAEHQRVLREAFAKGNGQEVDTQGDAFLVAFPRARDALATAVAAQQALLKHAWPDGASLQVRMGLHTGEPVAGGAGYVGMDLHRAARIAAAGHGGQILLSDAVDALVARDLPPGVSLRDLGNHRLKDLREPEHLLQVVHPDLLIDFPPLKSLHARPNNLPIQLTSFVGREHEIAEVKRLLNAARLVTLSGSGGAGKTRLALQVAADVLEGYPDGVWLIEFAPITEPALVPKNVASPLNVPEQPGRDMTETLVDALRPKAMLLVLDNCEHVLAACRGLSVALLQKCPKVRILATSREGLGVPGETLWRVPSLSVPEDIHHVPPPEELVLYDAVRLFVERAVATTPGFTVTSKNAAAVTQVCRRLDGIPLALELAAARVKVLAVEQIAARLDDRFRLLTGGSPVALPRHQTLRATINWSYQLLSDDERLVLRRLSVFAGGWTLEAAEAVCAGGGVQAAAILDLLTSLVDKSLVVAETQGGEARYRLLETVRQYGWERLEESNESEELLGLHLDFFLRLAEQIEPKLKGAEQAVWINRLETEHDNLRVALEWSIKNTAGTGLRLAGALGRFWLVRGHFTAGRGWLMEALRISGSAAQRAKALNGAGSLAVRQGDYAMARSLYEESLSICKELGDKPSLADTIFNLGRLAANRGDNSSARSFFDECLTVYREMGDKQGMADSLAQLGHSAWHQGDYASARPLLEESLTLSREIGQGQAIIYSLWSLGLVAFDQGNHTEAVSLYHEGLATAKELGSHPHIAFLLEALACLAAAEGQPERATRLLAAGAGFRKAIDFPLPLAHRSDYDRPLATIRAAIDEEAFQVAWAEGRAMTLEQAIEYALVPRRTSGTV